MEWLGVVGLTGFKSVFPKLTLCSAQPLSYNRTISANGDTVDDFFAKLGALCACLTIISKPMQIFNIDETNISVVHKAGKVVTQLGRKNVWSVTSAERGKTHTIVTYVLRHSSNDDLSSKENS